MVAVKVGGNEVEIDMFRKGSNACKILVFVVGSGLNLIYMYMRVAVVKTVLISTHVLVEFIIQVAFQSDSSGSDINSRRGVGKQ
jgi:hypothetical protein